MRPCLCVCVRACVHVRVFVCVYVRECVCGHACGRATVCVGCKVQLEVQAMLDRSFYPYLTGHKSKR